MKRVNSSLLISGSLILTVMINACSPSDPDLSAILAACNYTLETRLVLSDDDAIKTTLTPKCEAALAILPFENSGDMGFDKAPVGMKLKVMEGFQAIIGYPLALPSHNAIFGVSPNSIPLWHLNIINSAETMNKSILNYVLNQIHTIRYSRLPDGNAAAQYTVKLDLSGVLIIYPSFWKKGNWDYSITYPFERASTLIHEARHGDSIYHPTCVGGCDNNLMGPYGMNITYGELLLHGSGTRHADGKPPILSDGDVKFIGVKLCRRLTDRIDFLPPELSLKMKTIDCNELEASDFAKLENLDR